MPIDDREQQFERALARHLHDASGGACPDAEILAAYHERTLSLEEMAKWKEHIAACERCQEALALVEQTEAADSEEWKEQDVVVALDEAAAKTTMAAAAAGAAQREEAALPVAPASAARVAIPMRRPRTNWKWIVPIGALAAGIIVWIGTVEVQKRNQHVAESVQIAENRRAAEAPAMTAPAAPRTDALEQKQADKEKALRDESAVPRVVPKSSANAGAPLPSPRMVAPGEVAGVAGQLDKKKDATGHGVGYGKGIASPALPTAAAPPMPSSGPERGKNEVAEERDAAIGGAVSNAPMAAGAIAAPAPAPEKSRSIATYKAVPGVVAGNPLSTITGAVLDPSGAAVNGAVITAIDTTNGSSKTVVADAAGRFQLVDLPPDQYRVVVAHAGFAQSEQTVALQPRQNQQLQVQLKLGATTETVEVSAAATTLNTESSEISTRARNVNALMQLAADNPQYIVAPDKKVGWRVGEAGKIERTTDHGKTWKAQTSGVSADLRTGSATSGKVCWIVGKAGTILLTTDGGKHWSEIASPISGDLGGVHAADAQHASIWDVPNRKSYETSDGGVTWKPTANE